MDARSHRVAVACASPMAAMPVVPTALARSECHPLPAGAVADGAIAIAHMIATWVPHSDFGDPECPGFLFGVVRGDQGSIECNDCDAMIRTVPADQLRQTLNEMEAALELASEKCPHCGKVNLFPGFSTMMVYTCRGCGEVVRLSDDPEIDRIFGPEEEFGESDDDLEDTGA
jgi:hypothetical protein